MEETHNQTEIQRKRCVPRLRLPATNACVTLDCEFTLIFRKGKLGAIPDKRRLPIRECLSKKQRDEWFTQKWGVTGVRQTTSQLERRIASYPDEIVNRLIRMFSVKGDTVLDPFLGSGTTTKIAIQNERNSVGCETDETLFPLIKKKTGFHSNKLTIIKRKDSPYQASGFGKNCKFTDF